MIFFKGDLFIIKMTDPISIEDNLFLTLHTKFPSKKSNRKILHRHKKHAKYAPHVSQRIIKDYEFTFINDTDFNDRFDEYDTHNEFDNTRNRFDEFNKFNEFNEFDEFDEFDLDDYYYY